MKKSRTETGLDYVFIVPRGWKGVLPPIPLPKNRGPVILDVSTGEKGMKKVLDDLIESGRRHFLFIADPKIGRRLLKEEIPIWLQRIREKALDCDFHYAGTVDAAATKRGKK